MSRKRHGKRPADRPPTAEVPESPPRPGDRLQKVLAAAGIGSRRQCEELIQAGRIEVDGRTVTELGYRVDPDGQEIRVDGQTITRPQRVYYAVNKPPGVVSTSRDPSGRPRVVDLVPKDRERLFPVGRLDLYSAGLILLTNDGELANRLTHPRYGVRKQYRAHVAGHPSPEILAQLKQGVRLAEGMARVDEIRVHLKRGKSTVLDITLSEGRNREIRRLLARVGHKVLELLRTAVGPVRLGKLPPGGYRRLTREEVSALRRAARGERR